jgi:hypothetical protein
MVLGRAIEAKFVWSVEHGGVAVRGAAKESQLFVGFHGRFADLGVERQRAGRRNCPGSPTG